MLATSGDLVIVNVNVPLPVFIREGEYQTDSGTFTNAPGVIDEGQILRVRLQYVST